MHPEKISIVTINYNNGIGLEKTIVSVINQNYSNLELIVIDGGSTDESLKIIEKHKEHIDIYVSEKDDGVYDAMNKGVLLSSGSWINFMNSGDVFHRYDAVSNVFQDNIDSNVNLIYGNSKSASISPPYPLYFLKLGIIHACHQAMFFRNENVQYDLKYKIYADYDLVSRLYNGDGLIEYKDVTVCDYEGGGISSVVSKQKRIDKYHSLYNNFGLKYVLLSALFSIISKLFHS